MKTHKQMHSNPSEKKAATFLKVLAASFLALTAILPDAQAQIWDEEYTGSDLATSPWSGFGNYSTSGGEITYAGSGEYSAPTSLSNVGWGLTTNAGTVEFVFRINTESPGASDWSGGIRAGTSSGFGGAKSILFDTDKIGIDVGLGIVSNPVSLSTGVDYTLRYTYEFISGQNKFQISAYLDGVVVAGFDNVLLAYNATGSNVYIGGNWTGDINPGASATYSALRWNNDEVLAPIPEPSTTALVAAALALSAVLFLKRRITKNRPMA